MTRKRKEPWISIDFQTHHISLTQKRPLAFDEIVLLHRQTGRIEKAYRRSFGDNNKEMLRAIYPQDTTTPYPKELICKERRRCRGRLHTYEHEAHEETYIWNTRGELLTYENISTGNWWDRRILSDDNPYATQLTRLHKWYTSTQMEMGFILQYYEEDMTKKEIKNMRWVCKKFEEHRRALKSFEEETVTLYRIE